ncbi:31712_t:CDS:10 [Gigaspora margarita]|uniref:31712_t:CDS:1 n=1 Tax=Gigaspora margarita TaxID=4874 RepID=A0ABN7UPA3_GIGMA|nr:31712_t:CDS:10 [Gigaspora margarita]
MNCQSSTDLTMDDFFKLSFGLTTITLDPTKFVTNKFTKELFVSLIDPSLKEQNPTGILCKLFPYLVDIISRTIPIARLVSHVQEINVNNNFYKNNAFLDKIPTNFFSKILNTLVAANIPIPIYFSNDTHSQKGLKVLNELRDIIVAHNYHLFISVNQTATDYLETPFTKQLYKIYSNNREDCKGICNPNSIDISFHDTSENYSRPPLAISEIYYDESSSSTLSDTVKILTKFAFYIVIHVSKNDFDGYELNEQFISTINDISIECYGGHKRKILILFWGIEPQSFNKHKEKIEPLLHEKFINNELWIELVVNKKKNALFERIKKDSFHKLTNTENLWLDWKSISFSKILGNSVENFLSENDFALSIAELENFNRRVNIFYASYCKNEVESLKDKKHLKTAEDSQNYKAEDDINRDILKFQNKQKYIGETRPISVLTHFAKSKKNDEIKNNTVENDQSNIQRKEIKQQIEDLDITIYDFRREFVILSKILRSDGSSVLKKLYDINNEQLEKAYYDWILEGEAIQILEGVLLRTLNHEFLSSVLSQIMSNFKRQLVVLSVIGLKNSRKSTLLNYLFQCGFSTSAGRCTKGTYMLYRHTSYNDKKLDILIIDSEGIGSTAAKYISRHILEVSSYHLDALSNRDSNKPRICFVLRDMKDAKIVKQESIYDIRDSLKKMFKAIPGGYDMDDFMIVEKQDVHLLEDAFACSFDDFYPCSKNSDGDKSENFHYPAKTFLIKISKLREELLNATSENHGSQIFNNIYEFIIHIQAVWKEIDVRGNFLHFKDSKTIQQWSTMKKLVHGYGETTIKTYKEIVLNLIKEQTSKGQWNEDNDIAFENELTQKTELLCTEIIIDFNKKISNQYDPQIIDEGETYIKMAIDAEKRKPKATYAKSQREEHNDKIPEEFRNIFSDSKREELFNEE